MKTIYNLRLIVIAIIAMMATSAFAQDTLPVTLNFRSEGGTKPIDIDETTVTWKLICDASWVKLSPAEGTGAAQVTLTVEANPTEKVREAIITIDTGYGFVNDLFLVKQQGKVPAGISAPTTASDNRAPVVRTLSGMKVTGGNLRRGIYIVNGKKVIK